MSPEALIAETRPKIGGWRSDSRSMTRLATWWHKRDLDAVRRFVIFVGCPRSGHSLLGSLLDAHPDAVIAHELDALKYVASGWSRRELYARILRQDRDFTGRGRRWFGYDYRVPGQWQGRFRHLHVIGDKRGGLTTERLQDRPELLAMLDDLVSVPLVILHVTRNPFDNVVTMARRSGQTLDEAARRYSTLCATVERIRTERPDTIDVAHEDLVADVPAVLSRVCDQLGLSTDSDYLDACSSVVFPTPRATRSELPWEDGPRQCVEAAIEQFDFLRRYRPDGL
jgi:hypothetical protein